MFGECVLPGVLVCKHIEIKKKRSQKAPLSAKTNKISSFLPAERF
jgi:hypothetical protein